MPERARASVIPQAGEIHLVRRGTVTPRPFFYQEISQVHTGREGMKSFIDIRSSRQEYGVYFVKAIAGDKGFLTRGHKKTYDALKTQGITVPTYFEQVRLSNGQPALVISDLTEGGRYDVFSTNDAERFSDEMYATRFRNIPNEAKERLKKLLLKNASLAAGFDENGEALGEISYEVSPRAYMLITHPQDPAFVNIILSDLGHQEAHTVGERRSYQSTLINNIQSIARQYGLITGDYYQLDINHKFSGYNQVLMGASQEGINLRRKYSK